MKKSVLSLFIIAMTFLTSNISAVPMELKIITIEDEINPQNSVLKMKSKNISFPLSESDKKIIAAMQAVLFKLGGVGLAANQVNIRKNIVVIYIPESASLLRDDVRVYPMHTILNPEYTPVNENKKVSDFEGCYSVKSLCGEVPRYEAINLKYQDEDGQVIEKVVTGFYARVLQHEIDHLNGILITDRLTPDCVQGTFQEMLPLRRAKLPESKREHFDNLSKKAR
jgi:peptide deformylase